MLYIFRILYRYKSPFKILRAIPSRYPPTKIDKITTPISMGALSRSTHFTLKRQAIDQNCTMANLQFPKRGHNAHRVSLTSRPINYLMTYLDLPRFR